ncbi:MAG: ABC transporter permease [Theionarchaea archaeon]|nr:ABC transporter permease [Theionarchaea archaeon]
MLSLVKKPVLKRSRILTTGISIALSTMLFFCVASALEFISQSSQGYLGDEHTFILTESGSTTLRDTVLSMSLAEALQELPGVNVVSPENFYYETLEGEPVIIRGITPAFFALEQISIQGRHLDSSDLHSAILGSEISQKFHLGLGDSFIIPDPIHSSYIEFTVVGILTRSGFLDSEILIPLDSGWILAHHPRIGEVSVVRVRADPLIWDTYEELYHVLREPPEISELHSHSLPDEAQTILSGTVHDSLKIDVVQVYYLVNSTWKMTPAQVEGTAFKAEIPAHSEQYYVTARDICGNITSTAVQKTVPLQSLDIPYVITPENPTTDDAVTLHCYLEADAISLYYTVDGPWSSLEMTRDEGEFVYDLGTVKGELLFYFVVESGGNEYESPIYKCTVEKQKEKGFIQRILTGGESKQPQIMFPEGISSNFDLHSSQEFSEEIKKVSLGNLYTLTMVILLVTVLATVMAIFSSMTAAVFESRREIGILLSLGSRRSVLYSVFLITSLAVSLAAGVMGSLGGYGLLQLIHRYGTLVAGTVLIEPLLDARIFLTSLLFAVGMGCVATFFSVRILSSLNPSQALKQVYLLKESERKIPSFVLPPGNAAKGMVVVILLLVFSAGLHLYPSLRTGLPLDPDSWSHYFLSHEMIMTHHALEEHPFFYVDYNTHWPGITFLLSVCSLSSGVDLLDTTRIAIPLISSGSLLLVYALTVLLSQSRTAGVVSAAVFCVGGIYINRSSAVTKESLAFTLLLLTIYFYGAGRIKKTLVLYSLSFVSYTCLLLTHHITSLLFILVLLSTLIPLTVYELYRGMHKKWVGVLDVAFTVYCIVLFYWFNKDMGEFLQFGLSDISLLLSYLLVVGSISTYLALRQGLRKAVFLCLGGSVCMVLLPYFIVGFTVYPAAPAEFLKEVPPYAVWLILGSIGIIPLLSQSAERRLFFSGWIAAVGSFLLFALTRERSAFSFLLLFRSISYGYQLLAIAAGMGIVLLVQKVYSRSRTGVLLLGVAVVVLSLYSVQSGYLGNYYEQKDLYWMPEYAAGVWASQYLTGPALTDERLGKLLQGVAEVDYDVVGFSELMIKGEGPDGVIMLYEDMQSYGFVVDVNFLKPEQPTDFYDCVYANPVVTAVRKKE